LFAESSFDNTVERTIVDDDVPVCIIKPTPVASHNVVHRKQLHGYCDVCGYYKIISRPRSMVGEFCCRQQSLLMKPLIKMLSLHFFFIQPVDVTKSEMI
jgi:hypothetical protein